MASNNIILAVPSANSSVNYDLPEHDSAKLSFSPEDIDGLRMDPNGGLVISFVEGGNVTITNFQNFIDNGNTLSLADGTQVDPKLLFNALGGQNDNPFPTSDVTKIGIPAENAQNNITLESGKKYLFDFDLSQTSGADIKDGKMVIGFANGGKIIIDNYETAMADKMPPELSLASKTCVVTGDELITNIQKLAQTGVIENTVAAEETKEEQDASPKSKIANADMNGVADTGPNDATKLAHDAKHQKSEKNLSDADAAKANSIETAAGDDQAAALNAINTAAGGVAGGRANSGYGFGSRAGLDPFLTNPDIGPINPTALRYNAPLLQPSVFLIPQPGTTPDSNPIIIRPDAKLVDETNLSGGPVSVSGALDIDFGADGIGGVSANNNFSSGGSQANGALTSHGVPVVVSVVGNDYVGYANGEKVFDLVIDPQTGNYVFTQYEQLDHANGSDPNDQITLNFGVTATDKDGDAVSTTIQINVADDAPVAGGAVETIDETNLGPIVEEGSISVNFGQDGPGKVETTNNFNASGSLKDGGLTSNGVPVIVTATATGYVGTVNGQTAFTLVLNAATGQYTYTQYKNFDHANGDDPNDIITLTFGTKVTDYDGDSAIANIVINVKDDAPIAHNDVNDFDTNTGIANGNVITGQNGGAGAADDLSNDTNNTVTKVSFGDNTVTVPSTGTVSIDGAHGTLTIAADGTYTYRAFDTDGGGSTPVEKTFVSGPSIPDFDEGEALDNVEKQSLGIAPGNLNVHAGDVINISFVSEGAGFGNTLGVFTVTADGRIIAEKIVINDGNSVTAGDSYSYVAGADAAATGFFLIADGATLNNNYNGLDLNNGTLDFVYKFGTAEQRTATVNDDKSSLSLVFTGTNGVSTVLQGPVYFTSDRGDLSNINADGSVRVVSGIPEDDNHTLRIGFEDLPELGDKDYNDMVFDISITTKDCSCHPDDIQDVFTYTLTDGDGDSSTATLTLNGSDLIDVNPIFAEAISATVDETTLNTTTITQTGKFVVDYGVDGPGSVKADGAFTSSGSKLGGQLTSGGVPVVVTQTGNSYVGKAGETIVFSVQIQSDGSYTFKLFKPLDHADGSNDNDVIDLHFGVSATDCDGDTTTSSLTIHVKDDAPRAVDDIRTVGEANITGNVMTNDTVGQDKPGFVTQVQLGDKVYTVPSNGSDLKITTEHGILTINKYGDYKYDPAKLDGSTDDFIYTIKDSDGDSSTAHLKIEIQGCDTDDQPVIAKPDDKIIDETSLKDGAITKAGTITANFFGDGPGTISGNNVFSSDGSRLGGALTSGGNPVVVSYANGVYTGTAGGATVFALTIAASGAYSFKLFKPLDHANGSNDNDVIGLHFGVVATDADGDKAATSLTINVKDDAPCAVDDCLIVREHDKSASSNVLGNDVVGQDVQGRVLSVTYDGVTKSVPQTGTLTLDTAYGKLVIAANGHYTFTIDKNICDDQSEHFTVKIADRDGDTSTSDLSVNLVADGDSAPETPKDEPKDDNGSVPPSNDDDNTHDGDDDDDAQHDACDDKDDLPVVHGGDDLYGDHDDICLPKYDGKDDDKGRGDDSCGKDDLLNVIAHHDDVSDAINDFVFAHDGKDTIAPVKGGDAGASLCASSVMSGMDQSHVSVSDQFNHGNLIA